MLLASEPKRAIRLITSTGYSFNGNKLFNTELNILTVFDMYRRQLGIFMFKINNNMLPAKFCNLFILNSSIHSYSTRNSSNYHLYNINTTIAKKSFIFSGMHFWNSLIVPVLKRSQVFRHLKKT